MGQAFESKNKKNAIIVGMDINLKVDTMCVELKRQPRGDKGTRLGGLLNARRTDNGAFFQLHKDTIK